MASFPIQILTGTSCFLSTSKVFIMGGTCIEVECWGCIYVFRRSSSIKNGFFPYLVTNPFIVEPAKTMMTT